MQILDRHIAKTAYDHCKSDLKTNAWMWGITFGLLLSFSVFLCSLLLLVEADSGLKFGMGLILLIFTFFTVSTYPFFIGSFKDYRSKELIVQQTKVDKKMRHIPSKVAIHKIHIADALYKEDSAIVDAQQYNNLEEGEDIQVLWGAYSKTIIKILYKKDIISTPIE